MSLDGSGECFGAPAPLVLSEAVVDVVGGHGAEREVVMFMVVTVDEVAVVGLGLPWFVEACGEFGVVLQRFETKLGVGVVCDSGSGRTPQSETEETPERLEIRGSIRETVEERWEVLDDEPARSRSSRTNCSRSTSMIARRRSCPGCSRGKGWSCAETTWRIGWQRRHLCSTRWRRIHAFAVLSDVS